MSYNPIEVNVDGEFPKPVEKILISKVQAAYPDFKISTTLVRYNQGSWASAECDSLVTVVKLVPTRYITPSKEYRIVSNVGKIGSELRKETKPFFKVKTWSYASRPSSPRRPSKEDVCKFLDSNSDYQNL